MDKQTELEEMMLRDPLHIINDHLITIKKMKKEYYKQFKKFKKRNTGLKLAVNVLNAVSISTLVISITSFPPMAIASIISTSLATITGAVSATIDYEYKYHQANLSYNQLNDLYSSSINKLTLPDADYDSILTEITSSLSLILDTALPLSVSGTK